MSQHRQHEARRRRSLLAIGVVMVAAAAILPAQRPSTPQPSTMHVYVGTYTNAKSQGIYRTALDLATGALSAPELVATTTSPSFLAVHPGNRFLYAVNEVGKFNGEPTGAVSAYALDARTGALTALNQQSSGGAGPAHVTVDRQGRNVLVANYGGGSVASLPIDAEGRLKPAVSVIEHEGASVHPKRQARPYAHSINVDPSNTFAYAADLGADRIFIYRLDAASGTLTPATPPAVALAPGSGPRHFAFHPGGRHAYVINELGLTVTAFNRDEKTGALTEIQTIGTLPAGQAADPAFSTAEVVVHPSGRFLFGSNRGHDSLVVFSIDQATGKLSHVEHEPTQGNFPRGFGVDPTGRYLVAANQRSDSLVVFRIDQQTGALAPAGHRVEVGTPVSVVFVPKS